MEVRGLGHLRRRRSCYESATVDFEMTDYNIYVGTGGLGACMWANVSECGALLWRNGLVKREDWVPENKKCSLKRNEVILSVCENDKKACGTSDEKKPKDFSTKQRELDPTVFGSSRKRRVGSVGNQERKQDGGGLDHKQGKAKVGMGGRWKCPKTTAAMVGPVHQFEKKERRLDGAHFREHDKESDAWVDNGARRRLGRCGIAWSDITGIM